MPFPVAAAIAGGASLLGAGANAYAQGRTNKKTRQWNEKMYAKQNADNERFWHMQNEYNSPIQQMERLKEAGLNPNLVYGGAGNAGNAGDITSASPQSWNPRAPTFDMNAGIQAYNAFRQTSATVDNLKQQNVVLQQDAVLKGTQAVKTLEDSKLTREQREQLEELKTYNLQAAEQNVENLKADIDVKRAGVLRTGFEIESIKQNTIYISNKDAREAVLNSSSIDEIQQRIRSMATQNLKTESEIREVEQRINNAQKDGTLKDLEIKMRSRGQTFNDPIWMRMGSDYIQRVLDKISLPRSGKELFDRLRNNNNLDFPRYYPAPE